MKGAFKTITTTPKVFEIKNNRYSDYWIGKVGEIERQNEELTISRQYEKLLYEQGAKFGLNGGISKALFTQNFPDIDLNNSPEWCMSLDGENVIAADDYFVGNYSEFKALHDEAIAKATDDHKVRLINQLNAANDRLLLANVREMDFDITTSFVNLEDRVRFLNQYVANNRGNFLVRTNNKDGEQSVEFKPHRSSANESVEDKVLKRVANFVTTHSFTTAAKTKEDDQERRKLMKKILSSANTRFSAWVKSNSKLMSDIEERVNDPKALTFRNVENGEPLKIDGINPEFKPRPHQAAFVRQQSRQCGGICGFDVGLGKTFSALLAIQNLQSIHVKNKTIFCVPNTTLTNWRKEARAIYTDSVFKRCLFVGVREDKNGGFSVKSSEVPTDLVAILENKHDKIFMTMEAFESISLKDDTLERYLSAQSEFDSKYEMGERTADNERLKSALAQLKKLIGSKMKNELLELMGIDSLVIDEAHNFKNGKKGNFGNRVKWLSLADPSSRGVNGAVKAWYVRGQSEKQDGVLCLTATPITNSPLEIYSMLSLAVGEDKVNRLTGVKGADQFLENFCSIDVREESTVDGREVETEVFTGLRNVGLLRKLIQSVATIKNADDLPNGRDYIPNSEENNIRIVLFEETKAAIDELKEGYQKAKEYIKMKENGMIFQELEETVSEISLKTGETPEVLAHPFNFINKVTKALLDRDLAAEMTRYYIESSQKATAQKVIEQYNKLNLKEERDNLIGVEPNLILAQKMSKDKDGIDDFAVKTIYTVQVIARLNGEQIELTTSDFENQSKFLKLAEKAGLELDVKLGSKMAALLENINLERTNPKAKGGVCKQIIFCDMLGSHNKLKQALVKKANIPANKIVIFNAKSVKDSGEVQEIQDGFNADTIFDENGTLLSENKYEIIIANKKAEVGINLQKGTQAIHHLTVGWTPDSLQQRNGRGVRQGNYLAQEGTAVNVYHYDANGTFDSYKRKLIGNKANWINGLIYGDENKVSIENGLSKKDQEYLADLMGDETAYKRAEEDLKKRNEEKRLARVKQDLVNAHQMLETVQGEANKIARFEDYLDQKFTECLPVLRSISIDLERIDKDREEISKKTQELDNEPKDSATYASKSKKITELESKVARRTAVVTKLWSDFVVKNTALYIDLNTAELPAKNDLDKLINESTSTSYRSAKRTQDIGNDENHPLYSKWEEEKGAYDQMIEDYDRKVAELAPQADIDKDRLQALKDGKAILIDNFPALSGDFAKSQDQLFFIKEKGSYNGISATIVNEDFSVGHYQGSYNEDNFSGFSIITANSPEAEEIYQQMAKNDEKIIESYYRWSSYIPQVEKYIDSSVKIKLNLNRQFILNDENLDFKLVLSESDYEALKQLPTAYARIKEIYESQGIEYLDDGIYAPTLNIKEKGSYYADIVDSAIFNFCVKYNYPLNAKYTDYFDELTRLAMPQVLESVENTFDSIDLEGVESKETLIKQINHLANARLEEFRVIEKGVILFDYHRLLASHLYSFDRNIFVRLFHLALNLVTDYERKLNEKADAEKAKEKEALRNSLLSQYLVVSGNTFHYQDRDKNKFRESVMAAMKTNELDPAHAIAWLKKDKSFRKGKDNAFFERFSDEQIAELPANSWIIHHKAWDWLVGRYADDLNAQGISASSII
ncbi:DEAD/DEAH box helicase family protein [Rodentibacter pneumotropicus]|uniref:DEAD/DEAH box helicase family protein n=1 Tax=Rodentibacter pneumotropicus TaxID=758 RepID=UPI00109D80F6|nr:DEAD/DEAH box helicase family protein [Rodentibacter pneumotropicus]THA09399.1 hypothetical protein D3M77_01960 [Rodentibacter pneumotropicus]